MKHMSQRMSSILLCRHGKFFSKQSCHKFLIPLNKQYSFQGKKWRFTRPRPSVKTCWKFITILPLDKIIKELNIKFTAKTTGIVSIPKINWVFYGVISNKINMVHMDTWGDEKALLKPQIICLAFVDLSFCSESLWIKGFHDIWLTDFWLTWTFDIGQLWLAKVLHLKFNQQNISKSTQTMTKYPNK